MTESGEAGTGPCVEVDVKVRYAETDAQGVVYHGAYIPWFEVGRTEYCEEAGYPYARMEAEGNHITVVELAATYRRSVRYGETVKVRCRMTEVRSRGCDFDYQIVKADGSIAVEGRTRHIFMDGSGRPTTASAAVREAFRRFRLG